MVKSFNDLLAKADGKKSYLAAIGLFGLALYQASTGDFNGALQSALAGLSVLGLRNAIGKVQS